MPYVELYSYRLFSSSTDMEPAVPADRKPAVWLAAMIESHTRRRLVCPLARTHSIPAPKLLDACTPMIRISMASLPEDGLGSTSMPAIGAVPTIAPVLR